MDSTLHLHVTIRATRQRHYHQVARLKSGVLAAYEDQYPISMQVIVAQATKLDLPIPRKFTPTSLPAPTHTAMTAPPTFPPTPTLTKI
jgi:hypothetical protein